NFGIAQEFPGHCNLRFDDTNPAKEEQEYIDSIQSDVKWLGYDWPGEPLYASDYFDRLYEWAEGLIQRGLAYVDDQSQHDISVNPGTLAEPGKNSPFRDRSVEENLNLFRRMSPSGEGVFNCSRSSISPPRRPFSKAAIPNSAVCRARCLGKPINSTS